MGVIESDHIVRHRPSTADELWPQGQVRVFLGSTVEHLAEVLVPVVAPQHRIGRRPFLVDGFSISVIQLVPGLLPLLEPGGGQGVQ